MPEGAHKEKAKSTDPVFLGAHKIFAKPIEFVAGAANLSQIPETLNLPEIAFIGRSNVGKSSLLNALTNRKALARTSSTPGRTRQLNFFNVDDSFLLVDVPGYGYAKAGKKEVANWQRTLFSYLRGRPQLIRAFLLMDIRHGIKPTDREMFDLLNDAAVSFQIILTKADLVSKPAAEKMQAKVEEAIKTEAAAHPITLMASSNKKLGIDGIRQAVIDAVEQAGGV